MSTFLTLEQAEQLRQIAEASKAEREASKPRAQKSRKGVKVRLGRPGDELDVDEGGRLTPIAGCDHKAATSSLQPWHTNATTLSEFMTPWAICALIDCLIADLSEVTGEGADIGEVSNETNPNGAVEHTLI